MKGSFVDDHCGSSTGAGGSQGIRGMPVAVLNHGIMIGPRLGYTGSTFISAID
jgi:hypothetical protein